LNPRLLAATALSRNTTIKCDRCTFIWCLTSSFPSMSLKVDLQLCIHPLQIMQTLLSSMQGCLQLGALLLPGLICSSLKTKPQLEHCIYADVCIRSMLVCTTLKKGDADLSDQAITVHGCCLACIVATPHSIAVEQMSSTIWANTHVHVQYSRYCNASWYLAPVSKLHSSLMCSLLLLQASHASLLFTQLLHSLCMLQHLHNQHK